jgi:hypothetical protein
LRTVEKDTRNWTYEGGGTVGGGKVHKEKLDS